MRRRLLTLLTLPALAAIATLTLFAGGSAPVAAQQTETVELFRACNNVAITWSSGTQTSVVAAAITPASAVQGIWRFDNNRQLFEGFSPQFPQASDLQTVNLIDAVFICMDAPGTLTRPALSPGG